MTPAHAVLVLLVVLIGFVPVVALLMRMARIRLLGRGASAPAATAEEVQALSALEVGGFATAAEVAALSPRERRFVTAALAPRLTHHEPAWAQPPQATAPADAAPAAEREVPVSAFVLVCPACGTTLGAAADVAHYVGSCPGCSRRVATRRRGAHVSLTAAETVAVPKRRPRPQQE